MINKLIIVIHGLDYFISNCDCCTLPATEARSHRTKVIRDGSIYQLWLVHVHVSYTYGASRSIVRSYLKMAELFIVCCNASAFLALSRPDVLLFSMVVRIYQLVAAFVHCIDTFSI